jgi:DNA-binding HxlR family transcriptional regulator
MTTSAARMEGALADRDRWTAEDCSIDRAVRAIGSRTSMLLMRESYYGTRRFEDFARRVGVTPAVAAARLRELVELGVLERTPYRDPGQRTRYEYALTPAGVDFLPVVMAFMHWGDRHLAEGGRPPLRADHHGCGADVRTALLCAEDHEVPLDELSFRAGA